MNRLCKTSAFILCCGLSLLGPMGPARAETTSIGIERGGVRIAFERSTGRLIEIAANGHQFLDQASNTDLWTLQLDFPEAPRELRARDAHAFSCRRASQDEDTIELVWQDFRIEETPGLRVTVTVSLSSRDPQARWHIAVDQLDNARIAALHFPRIEGVCQQEDEILAVPAWMGLLVKRPRDSLCIPDKPKRLEWLYPGKLSLQCVALYRNQGPGLFLAADDTAAYLKRFCVFGTAPHKLGLEIIHMPEADSKGAHHYEIPYHVTLGTFEGDWFSVAERYRNWALKQPWAAQSRLGAGAVSDWVEDTALWVWNRGRSDQVLAPAQVLHEKTGLPVSVFWHWWHGCAYDVGFPEYLPPREGEQSFRDALSQAHASGLHAIVYMNQRLWGMTTRSWKEEGAEAYAVKGRDGKIRPEYYNTFERAPCASMCMGTPFWRKKYAGLAEQAVNGLGVDGIYMDQACLSLACYDPSHGHPLGGGTYWVRGFQTLQQDIRERARAAAGNVVLAGEGCGEAWLPHLDLMLSLQVSMERYAPPGRSEPIPFFHAVYHGHAAFFGNYSSLTMPPYDELWPKESAPKEPLKLLDTRFAQQFRLEHARAFVWGQQPTIANFLPKLLVERPAEMAYFIRLARLRLHAIDYLLRGKMLRPPALNVPDAEIDISRLSIYAGQKGALQQHRKPCPSALASAWQSPAGGMCLVVVNISDAPLRTSVALPASQYPIPESCSLIRIDPDGSREAVSLREGNILDVALPAAGACIYEFRPKR